MQLIRGIDGVKIAVYDPNPCGKREVLMVHGWPLSAKMYEYQKRLLLEHGFRVVTMDLPGFGRSDAPACGYSYDCLSDAVYAVVKSLGLCRFVLVGFSMGGAIVLRYMRRHRGYGVRKLALLAAAAPRFTCSPDFPLGMEPSQVDQLIEEIETDRARFSEKFSRQLLYTPHSEAVLNWFQGISEEASQNATIRTACSLRNEDGRKDLESVHVPTAIFHGKQDEVVPYALGEYQHQHIPCSELIPFEKSGHGVFYDELERFNGEFLRFLLN